MRSIFDFQNEDWHTTDINVESLWLIDKRDSSGKHSNVYHGNFIPQIPYQMIKRYTKEGDTVLDIFSGSGTTLFECEKSGRNFIGFDINPDIVNYVNSKMESISSIKYFNNCCDNTDKVLFSELITENLMNLEVKYVDLMIAHPPYWDIIKFTDNKNDLSNIDDLNHFIDAFVLSMRNGLAYLKKGGYYTVVVGDIYRKSEVIPLGFYLMYAIKKNFKCKMKGIIVKNIEGNRGKIGAQGIWKYRALKSDYYLFKHEYIFVFKKEG